MAFVVPTKQATEKTTHPASSHSDQGRRDDSSGIVSGHKELRDDAYQQAYQGVTNHVEHEILSARREPAQQLSYPKSLPADLKISAATLINPNSTSVETPTAALFARRVAVLLYQLDPAARVSRAVVPVHIVRRA